MVEAVEQGENSSCTSQLQAWGHAPQKGKPVHACEFAKNIKIVGIKADVTEQLPKSARLYRSEFDPRLLAHRNQRPIIAFNIDALAEITNGNCGILMYVKPKPDHKHQTPNIDRINTEEVVETTPSVLTVHEAHQQAKGGTDEVIKALKLNRHQQECLAKDTKEQASSTLWVQHRVARVTASVAGDCMASVKEHGLTGHSQVARVMGYYGSPHSAALVWGKTQECVARKQYLAWHRLHYKHRGISCEKTGLWVSMECPYIAASPDGFAIFFLC